MYGCCCSVGTASLTKLCWKNGFLLTSVLVFFVFPYHSCISREISGHLTSIYVALFYFFSCFEHFSVTDMLGSFSSGFMFLELYVYVDTTCREEYDTDTHGMPERQASERSPPITHLSGPERLEPMKLDLEG